MINYSAHDIERYLNRQMNAAEMHAFEKAMMDDPFLADAVDGYRTVVPLQNIQHDLELLQQRINNKKENGKVVTGFFRPWMQMAAVAVILSAAVILFYQLTNKTANEIIVVNEAPKTAPAKINKPVLPDSNTFAITEIQPLKDNTQVPVTVSKKIKLPPHAFDANANNAAAIPDSNTIGSTVTASAPPPPVSTTATVAAVDDKQNGEAVAKKETKSRLASVKLNRFTGVVVDDNNQPLPFANIIEVNSGVGTYADAKGNFIMVAADSVLTIETKSVGYNTANVQIRNNLQQKIVMRDEAVSYGFLSKEQLFERNKQRNSSRMKEELNEMESEPLDGWDNYSTYVLNNTRNSRFTDEKVRLQDKNMVKEVEVSFDVLPDGNIANFKVERSNCANCNNEAIRVLKDGPKWKSKSGKTERTRFTVQF